MPAFESLSRRSAGDINFENAVREREARAEANLMNPGMPQVNVSPGWDALFGGLRRTDETARARGMTSRVDLTGIGAPPMPAASSLRRLSGVEPAEGDFDATDYQLKRAALDRTLNDNHYAKFSQQGALNDADRARDPNMLAFDQKNALDRKSSALAAGDNMEIDHFGRTESLRRAQHRENVQQASDLAPLAPSVMAANVRNEGVADTNDAKTLIARIAADGKIGGSALQALARAAGVQSFGDPVIEKRAGEATAAILPNVPGQPPPATKVLAPEEYQAVVEHFGGDEQQALALMRQLGYRR